MRRAIVAVAAAGLLSCYSPKFQEGLPCSETRQCPDGQSCAADDRCYSVDPGADGGINGNALLASLEISSGTLVPSFDPMIADYDVALGVGAVDVRVRPTAADPANSTLAVNDDPTESGQQSAPIELSFGSSSITVVVMAADNSMSTYSVTVNRGPSTAQAVYAKASNAEQGDAFGAAVAISGNTIAVAADGEDSDGVQVNNSDESAGAVYVFTRNTAGWTQQAYVKAPNPDALDGFGRSIALFGDTLVVGAPGESSIANGINGDQTDNSARSAGAVYVFTRTGSTWSLEAYIKASTVSDDPGGGQNDRFGGAVALWEDTLVVGANSEDSNATGVNGDEADDSLFSTGAAYVFKRTGSSWVQEAYLKASNTDEFDSFGSSVAVSGDRVAIGAPGEDSSAATINGNPFENSAPESGAVYTFTRTGSAWAMDAYIKASNSGMDDNFGQSVALFGSTLVVGAPDESSGSQGIDGDGTNDAANRAGAVYVFRNEAGQWSQDAYLKASNTDAEDQFGESVSIFENAILVGALGEASLSPGVNGNEADNAAELTGAAYLFADSDGWQQLAYIKSSNPEGGSGGEGGDQFGRVVAIGSAGAVVGATGEASADAGLGGDQTDNSAQFAGAAYIFE